jgi:hypothetical protein
MTIALPPAIYQGRLFALFLRKHVEHHYGFYLLATYISPHVLCGSNTPDITLPVPRVDEFRVFLHRAKARTV